MLRFIWQSWWRYKERFILLLVGALIISSGMSYLVGMSNSNKGTVIDMLRQHWSTSYDIVVRPDGSRSHTENENLLEPNYLSGIDGGISIDEYNTIKAIEGIEVAAPISMIGYIGYYTSYLDEDLKQLENGIYRLNQQYMTDNGVEKHTLNNTAYFSIGDWFPPMGEFDSYDVSPGFFGITISNTVLLAAIDPEQEAKLVGLDQALWEDSRYFTPEDKIYTSDNFGTRINHIPVLVSSETRTNQSIGASIQRLDLPFSGDKIDQTMDEIKENGGQSYLDAVSSSGDKYSYTFSSDDIYQLIVKTATGADLSQGKFSGISLENNIFSHIDNRPSPIQFKIIESPYSTQWPTVYEVVPVPVEGVAYSPAVTGSDGVNREQEYELSLVFGEETYRRINQISEYADEWPMIKPEFIGFYNPHQLTVPMNPFSQLPMQTYRPASAKLVLDVNNQAVNPPIDVKSTSEPYGLLTQPPSMLTTLDVASQFLGDKPISAIRVKVAGMDSLNSTSQEKLEKIANEIQEKTGLITDITLGSSPHSVLTHVPAVGDQKEMGWIDQPWINIGSTFTVFNEVNFGFSTIIAAILVVAIVYVFATSIVSLYSRRREFAVLLSIGWRPSQLSKLQFIEATLLGGFVAMVAWLILGWVSIVEGTEITSIRFIFAGLMGLSVYWIGAIIPALLSRNIRPYETINTGEMTKNAHRLLPSHGKFSFAINHFVGKWKRSLMSIIAMALPSALLTLFLFVTFQLEGVMYTSWLGEYVALKVGPNQYVAMLVAFIIAILTTAEIMWQNISDRQPEFALLKAVGWRNIQVRYLVLLEGLLNGVLAGIIGLTLAMFLIWGLYGEYPNDHLGFILGTGIIPLVAGIIGAVLPAERAVRIRPAQGMVRQHSNISRTEATMKWVLGVLITALIVGLVYAIVSMMRGL